MCPRRPRSRCPAASAVAMIEAADRRRTPQSTMATSAEQDRRRARFPTCARRSRAARAVRSPPQVATGRSRCSRKKTRKRRRRSSASDRTADLGGRVPSLLGRSEDQAGRRDQAPATATAPRSSCTAAAAAADSGGRGRSSFRPRHGSRHARAGVRTKTTSTRSKKWCWAPAIPPASATNATKPKVNPPSKVAVQKRRAQQPPPKRGPSVTSPAKTNAVVLIERSRATPIQLQAADRQARHQLRKPYTRASASKRSVWIGENKRVKITSSEKEIVRAR